MALEIKRIVNEPLGSNCYILYNLEHSKEWIILTHEHHDHSWSVNVLKEQYCGVKVLCSLVYSERMGRATKNSQPLMKGARLLWWLQQTG